VSLLRTCFADVLNFMKNDAVLLDKLKECFGFQTDVEVAAFLGITKDSVSLVRRGETGLSIAQRLKIMDRLESVQAKDFIARMSPENLVARLVSLRDGGAEHLCKKSVQGEGNGQPIDVALLDLFKGQFNFRTDKLLAEYLGIKSNTLATVRGNKSRLGPLPRLRMLKMVDGVTIADIEQGIGSAGDLLKLMDAHILAVSAFRHESLGLNETKSGSPDIWI
jgi:hypothetical protein